MVPIWSSGFIVGTLAVRHAPGLSILFWRMGIAALVMGAIATAMRAPWPRERGAIVQMVVVELLLQAAQFVGIFLALQHGVPAGLDPPCSPARARCWWRCWQRSCSTSIWRQGNGWGR